MKRTLAALVAIALVGGCAPATPVAGLRPEHPRLEMTKFVAAESQRPTLRWASFPRAQDREADPRLAAVHDVRYDLRIWRAGPDDYPADLVYARDALPEPRHTLETDLQPGTAYLWTVRARFGLDGGARVTRWSTMAWSADVFGGAAVPDVGYFRFKTPKR